jgi:hypothetical protein
VARATIPSAVKAATRLRVHAKATTDRQLDIRVMVIL